MRKRSNPTEVNILQLPEKWVLLLYPGTVVVVRVSRGRWACFNGNSFKSHRDGKRTS